MSNSASDDFWKIDDSVRMQHVATTGLLHSHDCYMADGRQEVMCFYGNDDNNEVGHIRVISLQFISG